MSAIAIGGGLLCMLSLSGSVAYAMSSNAEATSNTTPSSNAAPTSNVAATSNTTPTSNVTPSAGSPASITAAPISTTLPSTAWRCVPGANGPDWNAPLRKNAAGDIECVGKGNGCDWKTPATLCNATSYTAATPGFACGANHQRLYGTTGYTDPNHWCAKGRAAIP